MTNNRKAALLMKRSRHHFGRENPNADLRGLLADLALYYPAEPILFEAHGRRKLLVPAIIATFFFMGAPPTNRETQRCSKAAAKQ